jgi:uncharacterized membrane protein
MTWPPRTIFPVSVVVLLVILVLAAIAIPWYRRLGLSRGTRRLLLASVIVFLLVVIGYVVVVVPAYWD